MVVSDGRRWETQPLVRGPKGRRVEDAGTGTPVPGSRDPQTGERPSERPSPADAPALTPA